jgi:hypothetical protein
MPKREEPAIGKAATGEYYRKLVADPHFVPFTLMLNWNSFHVAGDIAIATSVFEGDVTREGSRSISAARTCLSRRNRPTARGRSCATRSTRSQRKNKSLPDRRFRISAFQFLSDFVTRHLRSTPTTFCTSASKRGSLRRGSSFGSTLIMVMVRLSLSAIACSNRRIASSRFPRLR